MDSMWCLIVHMCFMIALFSSSGVAEDPYKFFTWKVTYGTISPLGVTQQGILINGQFPGPQIDSVTNDNIIINVYNGLDQPFLLSWNGIQQRKNSWQDGVFGTNCPIPAGKNFTYKFQMKDQIGSYFYFPSLYFHKAAGGFGGIKVASRPLIPVPFPAPDGDITLLIGDWYKTNHSVLRRTLDYGKSLGKPDGVLINGRGPKDYSLTVNQGKTYRLRISNVGLSSSLNFRIQGHKLKLVEVEGSHTVQNIYDSLDIHVGQSYSVLVTANQPPQDYYMVASTRFTSPILTGVGIFHYSNSKKAVSGPIPGGPTIQIDWSLNQARSIRWNLTASAARPNPQGSYHYGNITITRTIKLANSDNSINGKQRYAVNGVSFLFPGTPLKLADYYNIGGIFNLGGIPNNPDGRSPYLQTAVISGEYRAFIEIVFQNYESTIQSWHLDGYSFFVAGMDGGEWTSASRKVYNLFDAVSRCTTQVYPKSWTAILLSLDNAGMWNLRSETWERQYLGQQTYLRVKSPVKSLRDEYDIPHNALLCGKASGRPRTPRP
ncbi:L-ascorbate oxidase homolog [Cryptomeria japonica]|uniref:L-ascorbate oxidase homolog n=1 Tax=Cryptomeria japonica TaxID=3369 RepID=UPI0025AC1E3F|nr:L-ascorbate oxidase homolog [Cryptomeria japonica]XP_057829284.1 L-ascorbate oxidase homolog [Cryptomeria japonica]XP_057829285.1 L-ascorbate oxidase homolog [Cryptomeria japonica]